ncbi:uncharacterized protein [Miscanthus floridulus]|uniref:uncharacterized protein n=1 Tax=Miscanthus floridulus TaxID=154761 RepID=UPI0034597605
MSIPGNRHLPASASLPDHSSASDSDAEPESDYRPIAGAVSDSESDPDPDFDAAVPHHRLDEAGNGISALDLASDEDEAAEDAEAEDEDGDLRPAEAAARAFSEDERRRRTQLPAGAAARIVDAMRGVEFPGAPPAWAGSVPEDQWLDRLRSLRAGPN